MEEMSQQDRPGEDARSRRKRVVEIASRVVCLLAGAFWVVMFVMALRTGYLSWIGILAGLVYVSPGVVSPIAGMAGRKRLAAFLGWLSFGLPLLPALAVGLASIWPEGDSGHSWRPYRFDDELAAIEARRAIPDAENAAYRYPAVFALVGMDDESAAAPGAYPSIPGGCEGQPWRGEDHPEASEWLDSQAGAIDMLLDISRLGSCRWPVQADTYGEYTVPYKRLRRCTELLMAAGNRDLGEGRVRGALAKYFCVLRIADHVRQQPSKVDSMTGSGHERNSLHMIRQVLVEGDLSEEDITQIASHLPPAADPWPEEWERLLEVEKLHYMNLLGRLYEVDDDGSVRFARKVVISPKDDCERKDPVRTPHIYWMMSMPLKPDGVRDIVNAYFAGLDRSMGAKHIPPVDGEGERTWEPVDDTMRAVCNFYRWWAEMAFFDEQGYWNHRGWRARAITSRRGTWLVLGLRRYRDIHGAWPATLDEIRQYLPPEAFSDPTSAEAFMYVREDGGFRLYSKGENRLDEGGRSGYIKALHKSQDDIPIWPPPVAEPQRELSAEEIEEMRQQFEEMFGKDYAEALFKDDGNDRQ